MCWDALIVPANATARRIGVGSAANECSASPRLASPFQQPTIFAASSSLSSLPSSASCSWNVRDTDVSSTARTSTL